MLSERVSPEKLRKVLIPRSGFRPFPQAADRAPWGELPESVREAHIARGEKLLNFEWPAINADLFLDFVRTGNQQEDIDRWGVRRTALCDLVVAECIEHEGRFVDDIVNGIWAICEESYWGVTPHLAMQKAGAGLPDVAEPTVDLFAAETSALLSWTDYLIGPTLDTISPLIRPRIEHEIQRRILTPIHERDDFWWMGLQETRRASDGKDSKRRVNNWNPWICSNWLVTTLLIEKDEDRRTESVSKMMRCVDKFIDPYPRDGGCDEGPGYWGRAGASLFECLDWLSLATDNNIDVFGEPLIGEIGKFIYRAHINDRYFVNFADAPPILLPSAALTFVYGQRIQDPDMMGFGAWAADRQGVCSSGFLESIGRQLRALFNVEDLLAQSPEAPMPRDVWLPEIQVAVARDVGGSTDGLYIAAKGGHNEESHNHNDIGSFIVFADGRPLIVDAGVETYTRKTFSADRYDIWTMQSAYHSLLPTIDGIQQAPGPEYEASDVTYQVSDDDAEFALDIATAYPPEAGIESWRRSIHCKRDSSITISDAYKLSSTPSEITCSILTPCQVDQTEAGLIQLTARNFHSDRTSGTGVITYDAAVQTASLEPISVDDHRLNSVWGDVLHRVVLRSEHPSATGSLTYTITP
jgi:hypothetical protein